MIEPTKRFTNRVQNYLRYRPSYPPEIIPLLESECGLNSTSIIADIGSGTGFLSELFLKNGNTVLGVEPNAEMRAAGEQILAKYSKFRSIDASAENTGLADDSVDFITAAQSFHWFDRGAARVEFQRILKPDGWIAIIWNGFQSGKSAVTDGYQDVLTRYGTDYKAVGCEIADTHVETFFEPGAFKTARFKFQQLLDFEGLKGRVLSASYAPEPGHPNFAPLVAELERVFEANQNDGKVTFDYDTEMYYGQFCVK
jgi:SAM-dependent methyltransferase